jgi:hypothetical protein
MGYHRFNQEDLAEAVRTSVLPQDAGLLLSTSKAVEELRILTGDFVTSDEEMADEISRVAVSMGCAIVFDEQSGADTLALWWRRVAYGGPGFPK